MSFNRLIATAAVALLVAPAWAGAAGPPADPGNGHRPVGLPVPPSDPSANHPDQTTNPGVDHPTAGHELNSRQAFRALPTSHGDHAHLAR